MPAFQIDSAEFRVNAPARKATEPASFRLIVDAAHLSAFRPEWESLWRRSGAAEPMRSPAWLMAWWRHYGEPGGWALRVGVWHVDGQLAAVAPMCMRRIWHRPGLPMNRLIFLGADIDDHDGVCSEYLDITTREGFEDEAASLLCEAALLGGFGSWHEIVLPALDGSTPAVERFTSVFEAAGLAVSKRVVTEAPFLTLPSDWDAYLKSLTKKRRYNITSALRDFELWAQSDWRLHRVDSAADLAEGERILVDLHHQRWHESDQNRGAFDSPTFHAFHHDLMSAFLDSGLLDLYWLTVRGDPVAVQYQFHANGKTYFYQCGRKIDVPDKVRIGIVMNALLLQKAIARGDREFDFLGGAAQYKLRFTETTRPIVELRIAAPGAREWLRQQGEKLVGIARNVRNAVKARLAKIPIRAADECKP